MHVKLIALVVQLMLVMLAMVLIQRMLLLLMMLHFRLTWPHMAAETDIEDAFRRCMARQASFFQR